MSSAIEGRSVNRADLAGVCGVSLPTVDAWVGKGCPFLERGGRGREWAFDTAAVIEWRISRAVSDAVSAYQDDSGLISKDEADRRRAVAKAITAEIEADEALRVVVARSDAEAAMAAFSQVLKTGLGNAASKIAARATTMSSAPEIEALTQAELNRAFETARSELAARWSGDRDGTDDDGELDEPASPG